MATPVITILGLGLTGASLGLALQGAAAQAEVVGHDKLPEAAQAARKLNAAQRVEWNLHAACENASMVVLAMPLSEVGETLTLIREDLRPNTLVFVVTDVLRPAAELLAEHLPGHGPAVTGHPILNGIGGPLTPRADLFEKTVFVVAAGATTDPSALELAANFVESVGAQPLFMDPLEHDGISAGVEQLPQLLGLSLVHMLAAAPGWTEARRLAGRSFAQSTATGRSAEHLYMALRANRTNLLPRIEQFERELAAWKQWLIAEGGAENGTEDRPVGADEAQHPLQAAIADSQAQRGEWETLAELQDWTPSAQATVETTPAPGLLRQMFFGNWGAKKGGEQR